jgi:predicted nucleotidyltransferase
MILPSGIELPSDSIAERCRRYHVRELSVFGSGARGDMKPDSDIDILVEFEPDAPIGLWEFAGMADDLSGLLGRWLDLVSKRGLKPRVRPYALRDAKIVYAE